MDEDEGFGVCWRWVCGMEGWMREEDVFGCPAGVVEGGGEVVGCCVGWSHCRR